MWQFGLVDTLTAVNFIYNVGSQYGAIVLAAMADGDITKVPGIALEPIAGLGLGYKFIKAAKTETERRARIATLAALLSASSATAAGSTPAANAGVGGAIAAHIAYMRNALQVRGGSSSFVSVSELKDFKIVLNSVKMPISEINPYRKQFTENSKMIINNMFQDHTSHRYLQGSTQKLKTIGSTYLVPIASTASTQIKTLAPIASSQIPTTALIGWTSVGLGLFSFTILGSLYLFQRAERNRWQNQNDEVLINVTAFRSE